MKPGQFESAPGSGNYAVEPGRLPKIAHRLGWAAAGLSSLTALAALTIMSHNTYSTSSGDPHTDPAYTLPQGHDQLPHQTANFVNDPATTEASPYGTLRPYLIAQGVAGVGGVIVLLRSRRQEDV